MFSLFELSAMLLTLSALFGWINHKYLPLPHAVGLLVISVATSGVMVAVDMAFPARHLFESLTGTLRQIDFTTLMMDGMLAFLLFAGALHVDLGKLKSRAIPVALLAFAGTVISTGIVGIVCKGKGGADRRDDAMSGCSIASSIDRLICLEVSSNASPSQGRWR